MSAVDEETSDPDLSRLIKQFNESVDTTRNARRQSEIFRDYYDGKQWSDTEIEALNKRGQPCITDNRIKDKVEYLLGMERQIRTDPKAYPRTPKDDAGAEASTDGLRYVADCNHFPQTKSRVFENMCVEGFGGCEVIAENDAEYAARGSTGNKKVKQRYIRWDRLYFDGHSLLPDFSDARYLGIVKWMDVDEAKAKYEHLSTLFDDWISGKSFDSYGETYDDQPRWFDRNRKRVQILEHYFKQGDDWKRCVFTRVGIVEPIAPVVYIDSETGKPECPLILQSLYVDRQGNRYGVVKRYKDLQDEINKRRSKSLHLLSVNQGLSEKGAVEDVEATRKEAARPDGWIEYTPGMKLEMIKNVDLAEGQFKLLQEALGAFQNVGPNAALEGKSGDISGRAKQVDQSAGAVQLGILTDSLRYWQTRVMRATWNRMKQFWTAEQWVRVTDDEKTKFMALNSTYPQDHPAVTSGKVPPGAPMNVVAQLDMDIIIDEMPDVVTVQQEQFTQLAELAKNGLQIPPDVLIQASGLRNKQQILDRMNPQGGEEDIPPQVKQMLEQKQQQIQAISQAQQQTADEQTQKAHELEAETYKDQARKAEMGAQKAMLDAAQAKLDARESSLKTMEQMAQMKAEAAELTSHNEHLQNLLTAAEVRLTSAKVDLTEAQTELTLEEAEHVGDPPPRAAA